MTSTIALIERLNARTASERMYGFDDNADVLDDAATELTTLLQRVEKAEAERDNLGSSLRECSRYRGLAEEQAEIAEVKLREETRIVDRVWSALGISTYEQAGGKEISEIVADWKERCEKAETAPQLKLTEGTYVPLESLIHAQHQVKELTRQRDEALKALGEYKRACDAEAALERIEAVTVASGSYYCRYIRQMEKTECLGWEAKVNTGVFGKAEFDAHAEGNRLLGWHQALVAVRRAANFHR